MRIPVREVLFTGLDQCPEFDCCQEPLPEELSVLLCFLDGAEHRRQFQAKINAVCTDLSSEGGDHSLPTAKR
jgi:hypothetical protein